MWVSSLSLGGLSNYWTSAIPRYAPEDFNDGARIDERFEWPVTYDELVPYYDRLEPTMGLTAGEAFRGVPDGNARATALACRATGGRWLPGPQRSATVLARSRWPEVGRGWQYDEAPSSAAITASSRHFSPPARPRSN